MPDHPELPANYQPVHENTHLDDHRLALIISSLEHITFLLTTQNAGVSDLAHRMDNLTLRVHATFIDIAVPHNQNNSNAQTPEDEGVQPIFSRAHSVRLSSNDAVWSPTDAAHNFQRLIAMAEENFFEGHDLPSPAANVPLTDLVTVFTFESGVDRDSFVATWTLRPDALEHIRIAILPDL